MVGKPLGFSDNKLIADGQGGFTEYIPVQFVFRIAAHIAGDGIRSPCGIIGIGRRGLEGNADIVSVRTFAVTTLCIRQSVVAHIAIEVACAIIKRQQLPSSDAQSAITIANAILLPIVPSEPSSWLGVLTLLGPIRSTICIVDERQVEIDGLSLRHIVIIHLLVAFLRTITIERSIASKARIMTEGVAPPHHRQQGDNHQHPKLSISKKAYIIHIIPLTLYGCKVKE